MIYIAFSLILLFLIKLDNKKEIRYLFYISFFLYILLLGIRYGQGTDYYSYKRIYNAVPKKFNHFFTKSYQFYIEPFFYVVNVFAKRSKLGFTFVIFFSSLIMGYFYFKTIKNYSKCYFLSFFILYSNYSYFMQTAIRQGIAISITTYAIISFLHNRDMKKYILFCFFAMMFHTSAFVCMLVPFFLRLGKIFRIYKPLNYLFLSLCSIVVGLFFMRIIMHVIGNISTRYGGYSRYGASIYAFLPITVRFLFAGLALYLKPKKIKNENSVEYNILILYLFGSLLFYMLSSNNQASRLTDYFSVLEILYFSNVISKRSIKLKKISYCLIILLLFTLFVKDLNALQIQGQYYSKNPINYPYISIYNKKTILQYKKMSSFEQSLF